MTQVSKDILEQISGAYRLMAEKARYRPAAPSDGMGNITVPESQLDLEDECRKYAAWWWEEEDKQEFRVGCCDYPTRPAAIFAIEAVRCMCAGRSGGPRRNALDLLQLAVKELQSEIAKGK